MRLEIDIYDPADVRAFAAFLNTIADRAEATPMTPLGLMSAEQTIPLGDSDGGTADAAPAEAPKRRGRPKKVEPVVEEAPVEDQQPGDPDQAEAAESAPEDDIFEETVNARPYTREDVVEAMRRHAEKFGLPETAKNKPKLLGTDKVGNLPDDPAVFAAAIARFDAAVAAGVAGGV